MKTLTLSRLPRLDYSSTEALNTLSTNITFAGSNTRVIMFTSCQPNEGKSYIVMNLMRAMADVGKSVVLVDADFRKSVLVARYGIQSSDKILGLSHYLAGMCQYDDIVYKTDIPGAYMVLAGQDVANSLFLINMPRFPSLIKELAKTFDIVLIDTPPIGVLIDAAQIAKSCDGVVFTVSDNAISRRELQEAVKQIKATGCPVLGAILNKVSFDKQSAKKYYHKTYYTHYNKAYYDNSKSRSKDKNPKAVSKRYERD